MSQREPTGGERWAAVERWKELEVEQQRVQHAARKLEAEQAQTRVESVLERIREAQAFARQQSLAGHALSAELLQHSIRYTVTQDHDLREAQDALERAVIRLEEARQQLLDKLEQLSVLQRVRERRAAQFRLETIRREQRRVDDAALLRVTVDTNGKRSREASWQ